MADDVVVRTAARVLVIDRSGRLLLLASRDPADQRVVWFVPGGGVEPGETLEQAAVRELAEELPAMAAVTLRGPVWHRHHDFSWAGQRISQTEWFFVARVAETIDAATIRLDGAEERWFVEARWVSLAELADWPDIMAPRRLPELLAPILAGDLPDEPVDAGV